MTSYLHPKAPHASFQFCVSKFIILCKQNISSSPPLPFLPEQHPKWLCSILAPPHNTLPFVSPFAVMRIRGSKCYVLPQKIIFRFPSSLPWWCLWFAVLSFRARWVMELVLPEHADRVCEVHFRQDGLTREREQSSYVELVRSQQPFASTLASRLKNFPLRYCASSFEIIPLSGTNCRLNEAPQGGRLRAW